MSLRNVCFILLSSAILAQCFAESDPDLKIEVTKKADDCERVTEEKDLLYVHYTSFFGNGTKIESRLVEVKEKSLIRESKTFRQAAGKGLPLNLVKTAKHVNGKKVKRTGKGMGERGYDRGQPMYLPLGRGKVIKGLNDALVGMCIGEIRKITVPPHLAYGKEGYKAENVEIPPDTTLVFEAELILFNDQSAVHQAFTTLDTDNNDMLDEDEIRVMMGSFQYLPKNIFPEQPDDARLEEMFTEMFTQADMNKDSFISLDEFLIVSALQDPPKPTDGQPEDKKIPEKEL